MTGKIEKLTDSQIASLESYKSLGIKMGLATGADYDKAYVEDQIQKHRVSCGLEPATNIFHFDSPMAAKTDPRFTGLTAYNAMYGQHDSYWLVNYLFYRVELGLIKETEGMVHLLELAKNVGWVWNSLDTVIITARPTELSMIPKNNGVSVCHNLNDYAIKYRDGNGVAILNGLYIPNQYKHLIFTPAELLDGKEVLAIKNTEIRSEFIKKMGVEFMLKSMDSKILDTDTVEKGGSYELLQVDVNGSLRKYLTGTCPSKGNTWHEAVHPDSTTVRQALNWREWGSLEMSYTPPVIRT